MTIDYLVLTALRFEYEAFITQLRAVGAEVESGSIPGEYNCTLPIPNRKAATIVVHSGDQPGRVAAALRAHEAIARLTPRAVLVVGVAGGIAQRTALGEVVVADQVIDTAQRKISDKKGVTRAQVYRASSRLLSITKQLDTTWTSRIVATRPNQDSAPNVSWGPIASSDTIVTSLAHLQPLRESFETLLGVDMESGGVLAAIERLERRPQVLIIRGVADHVESTKIDGWREYASHAAAAFAISLIQMESLTAPSGTVGPTVDSSQSTDSLQTRNIGEGEVFNKVSAVGDGTNLSREVAGEACLKADEYARALADVLNDASGEICFALMGHWGRGKTYLARLVVKRLPADYDHVWFSAWKYRSRPEIWAYLYESFWRALKRTKWRHRIPRMFRGSLNRYGMVPLFTMLLSAAVAAIPLGAFAYIAVGVFGIIGTIRAALLYFKQHGRFTTTLHRYLAANRHNEKLGLQAAIGDDLESLVVGWVGHLNWSRAKCCWSIVGYILCIVALGGGLWWGFHPRPGPQIPYLQSLQWYPSPMTLRIILGALALAAIAMPIWLLTAGHDKRRLLLIVDDLDRMLPTEMLEVIESLKLFLEGSDVTDVVQVLIICEEESLREALGFKYGTLVDAVNRPSTSGNEPHPQGIYNRARAIEENLQKLFVAHLRLSPLSKADQQELLAYFIGGRENQAATGATKGPSAAAIAPTVSQRSLPVDATNVSSEASPPKTETTMAIPEFTNDEMRALEAGLAALASVGDRWAALGPRAILSYVLRYKLARRLLAARAVPVRPLRLAQLLVEQMTGVVSTGAPPNTERDAIDEVVAEVA